MTDSPVPPALVILCGLAPLAVIGVALVAAWMRRRLTADWALAGLAALGIALLVVLVAANL